MDPATEAHQGTRPRVYPDELAALPQSRNARRHARLQPACCRALRSGRPPGAGATLSLRHAPSAGRRMGAVQCGRTGHAEAEDAVTRGHHAPDDVAAGFHAVAGGTGTEGALAPDPPPRRVTPSTATTASKGSFGIVSSESWMTEMGRLLSYGIRKRTTVSGRRIQQVDATHYDPPRRMECCR
jgi:hypothetical protein